MTAHVIVLPNGRACTVGTYARAWRVLQGSRPDALYPGFCYHPERADYILAEMRAGLADRINRHDPAYGRGRKWRGDYQVALARDARRVADMARRVRVYQLETPEASRRFADRLARHDD